MRRDGGKGEYDRERQSKREIKRERGAGEI